MVVSKINFIKNGLYLVYTLLFLATIQFPFFWDTIQLGSRHAHFFLSTNFSSIILPNEIDSGHIPFLGFYLGILWKIFGKTLIVSHLAMFPFVIGIVHQSIRLTQKLFSAKWQIMAAVLLLCDATLLAQCTLISPDVLLVFFFLLALNSYLQINRMWLALSFVGLVLVSMRGMMCVAAIFTMEILLYFLNTKLYFSIGTVKNIFRLFKAYFPCLIIVVGFMGWHYYKTGWIGYHKNMPWYPLFETVKGWGIIRNFFILAWRIMDFGRVFFWISAVFCLFHYLKNKPALTHHFKVLLILTGCLFVALSHAVIFHKNLSCHRYLLPIFLSFALLVTYYVFEIINNKRIKQIFLGIVLIGSLGGNFWVYPDKISKGWDASLSYMPYFHLRSEMMDYMAKNNISISQTGSLFPNEGLIENIDLSGNFSSFPECDLTKDKYVFYSNIYNGFTDDQLEELQKHWSVVKELKSVQVKIILYKSPIINE